MITTLHGRRFHAQAEQIPRADGWAYSRVSIYDGPEKIGEYVRNYGGYGETTFEPFELDGRWYALYSRDYTATRLMSLPDCQDLGGEEPEATGFCPVELYVPRYKVETTRWLASEVERTRWAVEEDAEGHEGLESQPGSSPTFALEKTYGPWQSMPFGFVAGCIWGDDGSWKVEVIDLSDAAQGKITRSPRFGYLQLARQATLRQGLSFQCYPPDGLHVTIQEERQWDIATGAFVHPYD